MSYDLQPTRPHHYKIITCGSLRELQDEVNLHLANGYVLAGGVYRDEYRNYLQAVYIDPKQR